MDILQKNIVNAFQKILNSLNRKPNALIKVVNFTIKLLKRFFRINNIEMYSTYIEGKPVVAERFIPTLKTKIFKHIAAVSKNVYLDVLDNSVNKYRVHRTITQFTEQ